MHRARGTLEPEHPSRLEQISGRLGDGWQVKASVRVDPVARGEANRQDLSNVDDRDVVEVELENGFVFWTRVDTLLEDTARTKTRDVEAGELPTHYPLAKRERGAAGAAIRWLKIFGVDLPAEGARFFADKIERKLEGNGGLFRIEDKGRLVRDQIDTGTQPVLLFLHGTASSTHGAFRGLIQADQESREDDSNSDPEAASRDFRAAKWRDLQKEYGGRIYGFEHRTLTQDPLQNVIDLLELLPDQGLPPLHLVSHSRGGLLGDLLSHGSVGQADPFPSDLLAAAGVPETDLDRWWRLAELLRSRAPSIERFVRVGSTSGGTTLASKRLDIYFSILVNLLERIPGVGPLLGGIAELAAAVAKERTKPEVLPGLAAQMPKSPLVRALNGSDTRLGSDLTVIAGDSDGFLKNLANLFYWRANDLVVDTRSMYAGPLRERRFWYRSKNREVHHLNYFRRTETTKQLVAGLTRTGDSIPGFETSVPPGAVRGHVDAGLPEEHTDRSAVILIPGIMGSHLRATRGDESNRIWLDVSDLMKGRFTRLAIDSDYEVEATAVVPSAYNAFAKYLRNNGIHVMPFPYDWRRSILEASDRLARVVEQRLEQSDRPLRLVAHSMGGLVAKAFIARHDSLWRRLVESGGRLVQLGTPNRGSGVISALLLGEEKLLKYLATVDLKTGRREMVRELARFPGLLEMSPRGAASGGEDFFTRAAWERLGAIERPTVEALAEARSATDLLDGVDLEGLAGSDRAVIYVAGRADRTPIVETVADDGTVRLGWSAEGDGRVLWEGGVPTGVPLFHIDTKHGSLLDRKKSFPGLLELIDTGASSALAPGLPSARAAAPSRGLGELADDDAQVFPNEELLVAAALGMDETSTVASEDEEGPRPINIRVVHGDLVYSPNAVIVGHYIGDPIVHAEKALDRVLDGELTYRNQLGTYAGPIGTAEVVLPLRPGNRPYHGPDGAVVIGLGRVGELTPAGLIHSIENGLLRLVQSTRALGRPVHALNASSLLVGSGEAGMTMEQVVESILLGARLANRQLAGPGQGNDERAATIAGLDLVELYQDRALEALRAARRTADDEDDFNVVGNGLVRRSGRLCRASYTPAGGWWTRLEIIRPEDAKTDGHLVFTAHGGYARAGVEHLFLQPGLIDGLLRESRRSTVANSTGLPKMLFELLVPQPLKGSASDRRNLALVLDEHTASYPWEMLVDRMAPDGRPMGVGAGLLRELKVESPRSVAHGEENRVLVVGDPPSSEVELKGAQDEAKLVATTLAGHDWEVRRQIRRDPESTKRPGEVEINAASVTGELLGHDYRILHLAGHGVYDPDSPQATGMVLGDSKPQGDRNPPDDGEPQKVEPKHLLLSPAEIAQMRLLPELVFVNCCHLGRIEETPPHRLAGNLGTALIKAGVKAVVVAGWAVDDLAAQTFAHVFYEQMLAGRSFGDAVLESRRYTYENHTESNTWAAYQCYGHPGYRLEIERAGAPSGVADDLGFVDECEVAIELDNLVERARAAGRSGSTSILHSIEEIARAAERNQWSDSPRVSLSLARALGEIGEFQRALDLYERISEQENNVLTLLDLAQRVNLKARFGAELWRDAEVLLRGAESNLEQRAARQEMRRAAQMVRGAAGDADRLSRVAETSEVLSILGSAYKRLSMIEPDDSAARKRLDRHLTKMVDCYAAAARRADEPAYPLLNALTGIVLLGSSSSKISGKASELREPDAFFQAIERVRQDLSRRQPSDVWQAIMPVDVKVVEALARGTLTSSVAELVASYQSVARTFGSERELRSVADQNDFLLSTIDRRHGNRTYGIEGASVPGHDLVPALTELRDGLRAAAQGPG